MINTEAEKLLQLLETHGERVAQTASEYRQGLLDEKELSVQQLNNYNTTVDELQAIANKASKEAAFKEIQLAVKAGAISDRYAATRIAWLEAEQPTKLEGE